MKVSHTKLGSVVSHTKLGWCEHEIRSRSLSPRKELCACLRSLVVGCLGRQRWAPAESLAQSVLPPGLARAASLSPGETWIGDQLADYQFIIEQADPAHPRTEDAVLAGRNCVAFWVYNEDLGPDAKPPGYDKNPRTQAETSRS